MANQNPPTGKPPTDLPIGQPGPTTPPQQGQTQPPKDPFKTLAADESAPAKTPKPSVAAPTAQGPGTPPVTKPPSAQASPAAKPIQEPAKTTPPPSKPAAAPPKKEPATDAGFADEVLKPKEAPRKNPLQNQKSAQPPAATPAPTPIPKPAPAPTATASAPKQFQPTPQEPVAEAPKEAVEPSPEEGGETPPLKEAPPESGDDMMRSLTDSAVAASERKTLLVKIITAVVVVLVLAGLTIGGVFAYNKWLKPIFSGGERAKTTEEQDQGQAETSTTDQTTATSTPSGDADNDSLPDDWERQNNLDPNNPGDALNDPDFDQLNNKEEYEYETDPQDPDSDKDGYRDGVEVQRGYNPNGEGTLNGEQPQQPGQDYAAAAGTFSGTMTGTNLSSQDPEFTLEDDGSIIGTYNLNSDSGQIFSRAKGTFTFNKASGEFTATMTVKGFLEQDSVDYELKMNGQAVSARDITGTFTVTPAREVPWMPQDKGTFSLKKG